jgi:hypothetical protein
MSAEPARHRTITITINEANDRTRAVARMDWQGSELVGVGSTRPGELLTDGVAEDLSVSRALSDLIAHLHTCAWATSKH